jgi:hypothetical protein
VNHDEPDSGVTLSERARLHRIDRTLVDGLIRAFALADARPDLLRGEGATRVT